MPRSGGNDHSWVGYLIIFVIVLALLAWVGQGLSNLGAASGSAPVTYSAGAFAQSALGIFGLLCVVGLLIGGAVSFSRGGWSGSVRTGRRRY